MATSFVVPYDGSPLAWSALHRAAEFRTDQELRGVTVVPAGVKYARERGWLAAGESFDHEAVVDRIETDVAEVTPDARVDVIRTESHPPSAKVAKILRRKAVELDASVFFLGSENAGRVVSRVSDVGPSVSADKHYDVYIARHRVGE